MLIFFSFEFFSSIGSADKKEETICMNLQCISKVSQEKTISKPKKRVKRIKQVKEKIPLIKIKTPKKKKKKILKKEIKKLEKKRIPKEIKFKSKKIKEEISKPHINENRVQMRSVEVPKQKSLTAEEKYLQNHLQEIAQLIQENLYYPRRARKRGLEGKVIVRFHLSTQGKISALEVLSSSYDILGRAALKSIQNIILQLPKPAKNITLSIPIQYKLHSI